MAEIVLCKSEEGTLFFDTEAYWFYFRSNEKNTYPIQMYRIGNFDLTDEEWDSVLRFVKEHLKDGVL